MFFPNPGHASAEAEMWRPAVSKPRTHPVLAIRLSIIFIIRHDFPHHLVLAIWFSSMISTVIIIVIIINILIATILYWQQGCPLCSSFVIVIVIDIIIATILYWQFLSDITTIRVLVISVVVIVMIFHQVDNSRYSSTVYEPREASALSVISYGQMQ